MRRGRSVADRSGSGTGPPTATSNWGIASVGSTSRTDATSSSKDRSRSPVGVGVRKSAFQVGPRAARTSSASSGSAARRARYAGSWAASQARSPGWAPEPWPQAAACRVLRAAIVSASGETTNLLPARESVPICHQPMPRAPVVSPLRETVSRPSPGPETPRMPRYRDLFRTPEFTPLFLTGAVHTAAQTVVGLGLATLVYRATGSPLLSALALFGPSLAQLLGATTLLSAADRLPPRAAIAGIALFLAVGTAVLAIPGLPTWAVFTVLLAEGLAASLGGGVRHGLLNEILAREDHLLGRSVTNMSVGVCQILGFAGGGVLIAVLAPRGTVLVGAGLHLATALLARAGLGARPPAPRAGPRSARPGAPIAGCCPCPRGGAPTSLSGCRTA